MVPGVYTYSSYSSFHFLIPDSTAMWKCGVEPRWCLRHYLESHCCGFRQTIIELLQIVLLFLLIFGIWPRCATIHALRMVEETRPKRIGDMVRGPKDYWIHDDEMHV